MTLDGNLPNIASVASELPGGPIYAAIGAFGSELYADLGIPIDVRFKLSLFSQGVANATEAELAGSAVSAGKGDSITLTFDRLQAQLLVAMYPGVAVKREAATDGSKGEALGWSNKLQSTPIRGLILRPGFAHDKNDETDKGVLFFPSVRPVDLGEIQYQLQNGADTSTEYEVQFMIQKLGETDAAGNAIHEEFRQFLRGDSKQASDDANFEGWGVHLPFGHRLGSPARVQNLEAAENSSTSTTADLSWELPTSEFTNEDYPITGFAGKYREAGTSGDWTVFPDAIAGSAKTYELALSSLAEKRVEIRLWALSAAPGELAKKGHQAVIFYNVPSS